MITFLKKYKIEILAFFIPVLIFLLACLFSQVFPFGNKYIVAYDGSAQYPGFTSILMNVLKGKASLFYSFKGGLGYNFYATAIYYLFNPTNLLSIFYNNDNIMIFYEFIVLLRIGLCGLTMSIYLKYKEKKNSGRLIFSIAYALMAYNIVYFYNFMYFDTVVLLPLVILGLDRIIENKNPKTYIIFLTMSIISNYYIGSMVCIFSLLYFIYRYILIKKEERKGLIKTFIISSLLCGLMSSIILIPEFFELMRGKVDLYTQEYTVYNEWSLDFFASFYRISIASYKTGDQVNGAPNIYCSLFTIVYVILFFFNNKYSKKEKIVTLSFICLFLLCFSFNFLDYAWQFFQKPCWYPNRYSFVFSFLLIVTAYRSYNNKEQITISKRNIYIIVCTLILLIVGAAVYEKIYEQDFSKYIFLFLSTICIIEYFFAYRVNSLTLIATLIFIFEVTSNTLLGVKQISFPKQVGSYDFLYNDIKASFNYVKEIDSPINNFYRVDTQNWVNINNPGTFNYNGIMYFDSVRNGALMLFLDNYTNYLVVDECSTRFTAINPVYTSLLGFKYFVSGNKENYYRCLNDQLSYKVYINDEYLSLGFMVNDTIKNVKLEKNKQYENGLEIINKSINKETDIIKKIQYNKIVDYGEDDQYIYYDPKVGGHVLFKGVADKDYFIFANPNAGNKTHNYLYVNGNQDINFAQITPYLLKKGDSFEVKFFTNDDKNLKSELYMFLMDVTEYKNWIKELQKNQLQIITYEKDNYIKGKIYVDESKKTMFTSIPYDDGWTVLVDGKKIKYDKLLTAFIGFDLEEGEHIIEFKYMPKGFILGLTISFISLICSIFYIIKNKKFS